jgi:formylmethanofuran dehydrogenase subunit E
MNAELNDLLEKAEAFHSHLGPFLVLGLKAGQLALRELRAKQGDSKLSAQVELPYRIPISCLLDGVQFSTGCTIGNKRLSFKDSTDITLSFSKYGEAIGLTLKKAPFQLLNRLFRGEDLNDKELRDLSHNIATMNENELFDMKQRAVGSASRTA